MVEERYREEDGNSSFQQYSKEGTHFQAKYNRPYSSHFGEFHAVL